MMVGNGDDDGDSDGDGDGDGDHHDYGGDGGVLATYCQTVVIESIC